MKHRPTALLCALLSCGCSLGCSAINTFEDPAIVGSWRSEGAIGGLFNDLDVELAGDGDATLHFGVMGDPGTYVEDFDLDWTQRDAEEFKLDLTCNSSTYETDCSSSSFDMTCEVAAEGQDMDCVGDGEWAGYAFSWDLQ